MQGVPWAEGTLSKAALWGESQDHEPCGGEHAMGESWAHTPCFLRDYEIRIGRLRVPGGTSLFGDHM